MKITKFLVEVEKIAYQSADEAEFEREVFELACKYDLLFIYDKHYDLLRYVYNEVKNRKEKILQIA